jgi:hypothetical protein
MKYDRTIGIDPGVKTGQAVWHCQHKHFVSVKTVSIIEAMDVILILLRGGWRIQIRFEDCRLRKWKGTRGPEALKGVGSVERDCKIWQEFCEFHEIDYIPVSPQSQQGLTKLSPERFKAITGWDKRTSEHARDAGMLVYGL